MLKKFPETFQNSRSLQRRPEVVSENCAWLSGVDTYDKKIDDLINRSKRNNLVFRNIPEGEEKGKGCIQLIEEILAHHMKIPDVDSIVIEKAHRSTVKDNDKKQKSVESKWGVKKTSSTKTNLY